MKIKRTFVAPFAECDREADYRRAWAFFEAQQGRRRPDMLPSILTRQVRIGIEDHLRASFAPSTKSFDQIIDRFIDEPNALIKGPWLTLEMPFRGPRRRTHSSRLPLGFRPYRHQEKAFRRLSGERHSPR